MLCQPVYSKSNIRHFRCFSSFYSALFFFKNLPSSWKVSLRNNFCSFLSVSWSHHTRFGKLIFNRFWGVFCQPVHPESNIKHSRSFSLFEGPPWFFLKAGLQVRMSNFKIIFAPFLGPVAFIRPNLVKGYWTDFGGVLCEPVHPISHIRLFGSFPTFHSVVCFFW